MLHVLLAVLSSVQLHNSSNKDNESVGRAGNNGRCSELALEAQNAKR